MEPHDERRKRIGKSNAEEIVSENFSKLMKDTNPLMKDTNSEQMNTNKTTLRHIIVESQNRSEGKLPSKYQFTRGLFKKKYRSQKTMEWSFF